ncbi:MAG: hypothetical protein L0Y71_08265 [Gemmataceae bacterium]|nr:hypothetical protein [Gemmataceae bacterium]
MTLAAAAAVGGVRWWQQRLPRDAGAPTDRFPLPPLSKSPFLNTGPEASYVGINACKGCHHDEHRSYLLTAHSRSLSDLDPNAEPPDGGFQHKPSARSYRVYREGQQLRHEELLRDRDGREILRLDLPIRYLIGSGRFTRSYLVEIDGFLVESPITWYASRQAWDISPGYDFPGHMSFERPIMTACIVCHAGHVEPQGNAVHRFTIHEAAIGCERCHGPGSVHVDFRRAGNSPAGKLLAGDDDRTIVNPGKLSRSDLESLCADCHLNGLVTTFVRGRRETDYRPGMPLSDYRIDYRVDTEGEKMTVVGHVEQLRQSACYQKSTDLSCLTCHDPHAAARPKDPVAFHRQKCLSCHSIEACRLAPAQRLKKDATDNCIACHMPRGDTDIPHVAFTHHRIGRHAPAKPGNPPGATKLVPISDISHLGDVDRKRNLGLAYLLTLDARSLSPAQNDMLRTRARTLLEEVEKAIPHDGDTLAAQAIISLRDQRHQQAVAYAERALRAEHLRAEARADALLVIANGSVLDRDYQRAIDAAGELTKLRLYSEDWRLLGMCYLEEKQTAKAEAALRRALTIRPSSPDIHRGLAILHERLGNRRLAKEHADKAQWLIANGQQ